MAQGPLQKQVRKLAEKVDGKDVYAVDITNDDLERIEEISDDHDELGRQAADLSKQIRECEDTGERQQLRGEVRDLSSRQRALDSEALARLLEDKDGEKFALEIVAALPVRIQLRLQQQANKLVYGGDEDPTQPASVAR